MKAFHNSEEIKKIYVERIKDHRRKDQILQNFAYWRPLEHRGCAVGCTMHNAVNPHQQAEVEIGFPYMLMQVEDTVFENINAHNAGDFAVAFLEETPVGADLTLIVDKLMVWMFTDIVLPVLEKDSDVAALVNQAIALFSNIANGGERSYSRFNEMEKLALIECNKHTNFFMYPSSVSSEEMARLMRVQYFASISVGEATQIRFNPAGSAIRRVAELVACSMGIDPIAQHKKAREIERETVERVADKLIEFLSTAS